MGTDFTHDVIGAPSILEYADQMCPHLLWLFLATDEVITLDFEFQFIASLNTESISNTFRNRDLALARQFSSHTSKVKTNSKKVKKTSILLHRDNRGEGAHVICGWLERTVWTGTLRWSVVLQKLGFCSGRQLIKDGRVTDYSSIDG